MKIETYYCDICGKVKDRKDIHSVAVDYFSSILNPISFDMCSECLDDLRRNKDAVRNSITHEPST